MAGEKTGKIEKKERAVGMTGTLTKEEAGTVGAVKAKAVGDKTGNRNKERGKAK